MKKILAIFMAVSFLGIFIISPAVSAVDVKKPCMECIEKCNKLPIGKSTCLKQCEKICKPVGVDVKKEAKEEEKKDKK